MHDTCKSTVLDRNVSAAVGTSPIVEACFLRNKGHKTFWQGILRRRAGSKNHPISRNRRALAGRSLITGLSGFARKRLLAADKATPLFSINAQHQHHTWVRWATGKKSVLHPFPHLVLLLPVRKPPTVLRSCTVYYRRDIVFSLPGFGSSLAKSDSERSTRSRNRGKGRRGRGRGERDWGGRSYDDEPEERSKCLKSAYAKCVDQENGHSISS